MIYLSEKLFERIKEHAERAYPNECGGMLIGFMENGRKLVTDILPMENAMDETQQHDRILILPKDVLRAERFARTRNAELVGYYHSHPGDRAVPSQFDLDHALPVWSYIIVSVIEGAAKDVRSWEMQNDRAKFNEEKLFTKLSAAV